MYIPFDNILKKIFLLQNQVLKITEELTKLLLQAVM